MTKEINYKYENMFWQLPRGMIQQFQIALYDGALSFPLWVWVDEHHINSHKPMKSALRTSEVSFDQHDVQNFIKKQSNNKIMLTRINDHDAPHMLVSTVNKVEQITTVQTMNNFAQLNGLVYDEDQQDSLSLDMLYFKYSKCQDACSEIVTPSIEQILMACNHQDLLISASLEINTDLISDSLSGRTLSLHNAESFCNSTLNWFLLALKQSSLQEIKKIMHCKLLELTQIGNIFNDQQDCQFVGIDVALNDIKQLNKTKPQRQISDKTIFSIMNMLQLNSYHDDKKIIDNSLYKSIIQNEQLSEMFDPSEKSYQISSQDSVRPQIPLGNINAPELCVDCLKINIKGESLFVPQSLWSVTKQELLKAVELYSRKTRYIKIIQHPNNTSQSLKQLQTFQSCQYEEKQITQAMKYLRQTQIIGRILTSFYSNQFHMVIIGPTQIANLLGRSLSALLPPCMRDRVIYARDEPDVYCSHVEMVEGLFHLLNTSKKQYQQKDEKNIFSQKSVCPTCFKPKHIPQLIQYCSIQCINSDYSQYHVDDFLQLKHSTCVVNLLASSEDQFVINFAYQKGFQFCALQAEKLKISGQVQQLLNVYQNALHYVQQITNESQNAFLEVKKGFDFLQQYSVQIFSMATYLGEATIGHFVGLVQNVNQQKYIINKQFKQIQYEFIADDMSYEDLSYILKAQKPKYALSTSTIVSLDRITNSLGWHVHMDCLELLGGFYAYNAPDLINCPFVRGGETEMDIVYKYILEYFITEIFDLLEVNSPLAL